MSRKNSQPLNVLHLARWYPNRYDPMFGLFVRRHIQAIAPSVKVALVYAHAVSHPKTEKKFEIENSEAHGFPEIIVYYRMPDIRWTGINSLLKSYRFFKANYLGIKRAKELQGSFNLVHVHILTRLGMIALFLKYFYGIPYVITEHWSRYLSQTGHFKGALRKFFTKLSVKNASAVTTVTTNLAKAMKSYGLQNRHYFILPNVISPVFFKRFPENRRGLTHFVHVSCFEDRSKNMSGILRAVKKLSEQRTDFRFTFIGVGKDWEQTKNYAQQLQIPKNLIEFTGLLEGENLARQMATGNLLVIFSNYENMPVVINESFALGIPVLATNVGGISEVLDSQKGILIPPKDEKALLSTCNDFLDKKYTFNINHLKNFATQNFSYSAVGQQLITIYKTI